MRKTSFSLSKCKVHGHTRYCVTTPRADGPGRQRRFFDDKKAATTFLDLKEREIENHGLKALGLGDQQRADLLWCDEQLKPYGLSVRQAVEQLLPQLKAREHGMTVAVCAERLLENKRAAGLSDIHLLNLKNRLKRFKEQFAARTLASFTHSEIEQWLQSLPVAAQTANHYKAVCHSLFGYGVRLGACVANPVSGIDSRKVVRGAPAILTAAQFSALLAACDSDKEMLPFVSVAGFAGLRRAEIQRLRWEDVNLKRNFITVGAQAAKTSQRRLVPVCDALHEWLSPIAKDTGLVAPSFNFRKRFDAVRKAAGLLDSWEGNELRHSYASYRLAKTQNAAKTALELGNSPKVLQAHYRELATPADAKTWFAVKPNAPKKPKASKKPTAPEKPSEPANVVAFAA